MQAHMDLFDEDLSSVSRVDFASIGDSREVVDAAVGLASACLRDVGPIAWGHAVGVFEISPLKLWPVSLAQDSQRFLSRRLFVVCFPCALTAPVSIVLELAFRHNSPHLIALSDLPQLTIARELRKIKLVPKIKR